jgi:uncharacterized protein (TIGR04141 family)
MATKRIPLTIYRIRDEIDGQPVRNFEDAIAEPSALTPHEPISDHNYQARLFVAEPNRKPPPWVEFLEPGFGDLTEVSDSVSNSAVLIAKVEDGKDVFFAITFGFGRYLLRPDAFVHNYGLRFALNALYPRRSPDQDTTSDIVRAVNTITLESNTLHARRQRDTQTVFEDFGIDILREMLRGIVGQPIDTDTWGSRLSGAHSLKVSLPFPIADLGDFLTKIEKRWKLKDYRQQFPWIEKVRAVMDLGLKAQLEQLLLNRLISRRTEHLTLAPPEPVDWDKIAFFRFSVKHAEIRPDLELESYLDILDAERKLRTLNMSHLRRTHRVEALDSANQELYVWSLLSCLSGQITLDDKIYLLNDGEFLDVERDYREELDTYVGSLPESAKHLPKTKADTTEGEYNKTAAQTSPKYLLLDKRLVKLSTRTSPVEICDILSDDGCFIHVKRKLASSTLSHLFGQGYVSADLFQMSQKYREAMLEQIQAAEADREKIRKPDEPSFIGRFSTLPPVGTPERKYEIVYAIIAPWDSKGLVDALPFFSKVNLRLHAENLRRIGYKVTYKRVQAK